jgi:hydrogenase maturation protease
LIIGLGNPILGDDGIGWRVAQAVETAILTEDTARNRVFPQDSVFTSGPAIEVDCFALGGLSLMERLIGYERAIIIDAVQTADGIPGQVYDLSLEDLPDLSTGHLTAAHDTSLQTALRLGRLMEARLPTEIRVVGVEAARVYDFSEALTPAVEASIPEAAHLVMRQINEWHVAGGM